MTTSELKQILDNERFDPRVYSLDGGMANDTLCLSREGCQWIVYYTERGLRFDDKCFESESDACNHLLSLLRSLPEYQTRLPPTPRS